MVLNMDKTSEALLKLPVAGERYTLSAPDIFAQAVLLNGKELRVGSDGTVPSIHGEVSKPGTTRFPPLTITFVEISSAGNQLCAR